MGAEVTAAAGDDEAADFGLAAAAGFTIVLIQTKSRSKVSRATFDVDVIAKRGTLQIHGVVEHAPHGFVEGAELVGRNASRLR